LLAIGLGVGLGVGLGTGIPVSYTLLVCGGFDNILVADHILKTTHPLVKLKDGTVAKCVKDMTQKIHDGIPLIVAGIGKW